MNFRSYNFKRNPEGMHSRELMRTTQERQDPANYRVITIQISSAFCNFDELRDRKERFYDSLNRLQSSSKIAKVPQEKLKVVPEDHLPYKRGLPELITTSSLLHAPKLLKEDALKATEGFRLSKPYQKSQRTPPEQKTETTQSFLTNSFFSSSSGSSMSNKPQNLFTNSFYSSSSDNTSSMPNKPQTLFEGNEISNIGTCNQPSRISRSLKINTAYAEQDLRETGARSILQTQTSIMSPETKSQAFVEPKTPTFSHSQNSVFSSVSRNAKTRTDDSQTGSKNQGSLLQSHHKRSPSILDLPKSESSELIKPVAERVQPSSKTSSANMFLDQPVPCKLTSDQSFSLFARKSNYKANQIRSDE